MDRPDSLEPFIIGPLREGTGWFTASVETTMAWPDSPVETIYLDKSYWLLPETKRTPPAIASLKGDDKPRSGKLRVMRFLSALAWTHSAGLSTSGIGGCGRLRIEGPANRWITPKKRGFHAGTLPVPATDLERLVLALMREARSLRHPAYSFLTFYRAIEALVPGKERKDWIPAQIDSLLASKDEAVHGLWHLGGSSAGLLSDHLREARRCAIAHGKSKSGKPVVDPDDLLTRDEIQAELRLVERLAECAIIERLTFQPAC